MTLKQIPQNSDKFRTKFHKIELELNAILEITQAINNNKSEEDLYQMYKFTLRGNFNIQKVALYVLDETWGCKASFGTKHDFSNVPLENEDILSVRKATAITSLTFKNHAFLEFDQIIPIFHKELILAYVFLENIVHESEEEIQESTKEEMVNTFEKISLRTTDTRFVQALSNIILVAIENKKLVRRQISQEAYKKEMEIAKKVQAMLFPECLPYEENLKVKSTYFPHDLIGGDYYDFVNVSEDKFIFCIADVSGKGIPAALLMSNFQASLRTLVRQTTDLKQIVEELNYLIYQNAKGEHFITFFICLYDKKEKNLKYINAGHNPAFLFDLRKEFTEPELLESGTTILGSFHPLPFLTENTIEEMSNFLLFTYTDGITEARSEGSEENKDGEEYSLDRLLKFMKIQKQSDLKEIHEKLITEIDGFRGKRPYIDDVTLLSCRVKNF